MNAKPNKILVMFSTQNDIISLIIRFLTWSYYSHVDYIDGDNIIGATGIFGVRKMTLKEKQALSASWAIYEFEGDPVVMRDAMRSIIGMPYDYSAIFGFLIRSNWEHPGRWFCSEAVSWAAKKAGTILIKDVKHRITPRDLCVSPLLTKVDSSDTSNK